MAKRPRGRSRPRRDPANGANGAQAEGTGGFLGQVGLFESANGLPHGPAAVVLAFALAVIVYPIVRVARWASRR